jgi:hypothetical protein
VIVTTATAPRPVRYRGRLTARRLLFSFLLVSALLAGLLLAHSIATHHGQVDGVIASGGSNVVTSVDSQPGGSAAWSGPEAASICPPRCEEPAETAAALCILALMVPAIWIRVRGSSLGGTPPAGRDATLPTGVLKAAAPTVANVGALVVCRT